MKKQILSMIIAIVMIVGMVHATALTAFAADEAETSVTDTATIDLSQYADGETVNITEDSQIIGDGTEFNVTLNIAADATVIFEVGTSRVNLGGSITVADGKTLTLRVKGNVEHTVKGGISLGNSANVIIEGDLTQENNKLTVTSSGGNAGIGANNGVTAGDITIRNARVDATGSSSSDSSLHYISGAGIGTSNANMGNILIENSIVTAAGGYYAAGSSIVYDFFTHAAAIGMGSFGVTMGNITLIDSEITASNNGDGLASVIGAGGCAHPGADRGDISSIGNMGNITITNTELNLSMATSQYLNYGAMIGLDRAYDWHYVNMGKIIFTDVTQAELDEMIANWSIPSDFNEWGGYVLGRGWDDGTGPDEAFGGVWVGNGGTVQIGNDDGYYEECTNTLLHTYDNLCDDECNVCGITRLLVHTEGTAATCTQKAVCKLCRASYGEVDPDNHTGTLGTYAPTADGSQHAATYSCCGTTVTEDHTAEPTYTPNTNDSTKHDVTYSCCGATVTEDHSGGTATCQKQAVCVLCGTSYGKLDADNHESEEFTYTANADGTTHTKKYKCCDAVADEAEAHDHTNGKCVCGVLPTPDYTVPTNLTATYGDTLANVTLPAGFTWQDAETTSVGNAGSNTFKVTYTPDDPENYKTVSDIEVTIQVAKADPEYTVPTGLTVYVGQTLNDIDLPSGWTWHPDEESDFVFTSFFAGNHGASARYTPEDTENYNTIEWYVEFTVLLLPIDGATVTVSGTHTYNGSAIAPDVIVIIGEKTLTKGTDYTVSYSDNVNAGTATVTITGKGDYTGTVSTTFTIEKATPEASHFNLSGGATYDGSVHAAHISRKTGIVGMGKITGGGHYDANGTFVADPINAGTYTVKLNIDEGDNYKAVTGLVIGTITIEKATPVVTAETLATMTYTGEAQTLAHITTTGGTLQYALYKGAYDETGPHPAIGLTTTPPTATNAGTYTVFYLVEGNDNYESVEEKYIIVTIGEATPTLNVTSPVSSVLPGNTILLSYTLTGVKGEVLPNRVGIGSAKVGSLDCVIDGLKITVPSEAVIGGTDKLVVKLIAQAGGNYGASEEFTLTLDIGMADFTGEIAELKEKLAALEGKYHPTAEEINGIKSDIEALENGTVTDSEFATKVSEINAEIEALEEVYATKAELNTAVADLTALINTKADADALNEAIENINEILGTIPAGTDIGTELASLTLAIETLNTDVTTNASGISENKNAILTLATTVNTLKTNLEAKDTELAGKLATLEENLGKLEDRVAANEEAIKKLESLVEQLRTDVNSNDTDISNINATIADINNTIATLASLDYVDGEIAELAELIAKLTERVTANEGSIKTNANEIASLKTNLESLKTNLEAKDAELAADIAELVIELDKLEERVAANEANIAELKSKLETAIADLNDAITSGDNTLSDEIDALEKALADAKSALKQADAANKSELEGKITEAQTALQAAIDQVQTNLDNAKAELDKAIADLDAAMKKGDVDLSTEIANLNTALTNAKAALEKADADNKAELVSKIETADATLDAAIKQVQKNLDDAKSELNQAIADGDTALDARITDLNTALENAKSALEAADTANKTELEGKITEAQTVLQAAIDQVQTNLDNAKAELSKAIADLDAAMKQGDADLSTEIANLNTALANAKAALEKADADNKAEIVSKIETADATLDAAIKAVQKNLDNAKAELNQAIADGDTALDARITDLNTALENAKSALEAADTANKSELEGKITEAQTALQAAIDQVQTNLDNAKAELSKAIADGDTALDGKITSLNEALAAAKSALEATDAANKSELTTKIDEAYASLDAAIKAVQKNLDELKSALEAKDNQLANKDVELENKDSELQTFIIIVCVISGAALCGSGAFVVWFFIDRKKRI